MVEGTAQQRRGGVVEDQRDAEFAADLGDLGNGKDVELGVGQGLGIVGAGTVVGGVTEALGIGGVDKTNLDADVAHGVVE